MKQKNDEGRERSEQEKGKGRELKTRVREEIKSHRI
jgi:hypothetical protein